MRSVTAVLLGDVAAKKIPLKYVRFAAAALFAALGIWVLITG